MAKFRSFSVKHKGAKHVGDELCQDASIHIPLDNAAIAVVADGHGSSRCFRSDIGSQTAVDVAENTIKFYFQNAPEAVTNPEDFRIELQGIVRQIINRWFAAVMKDEESHPLQKDPRLEGITEKYRERYINNADYRSHAYGTTLLVAVMSESYWFGFHVGDGKCVVLYEDGSWKTPIPWDDKCSFNITTSICDDDSLSSFRYWFGIKESGGGYAEYRYGVKGQGGDYPAPYKTKSRPLAIFVASDGVEDSFPTVNNDNYVINFYRNRIVGLAESGFDSFKEEINDFAKRFADRESKDDVSIAGIVGDFTGKSEMIAKMKQESEIHEKGELASVKRRDADEKEDALNAVQKRTAAVTANQRQLESRIESVESELAALDSKKRSYEYDISKGKAEIEESDRAILNYNSKLSELERDKSECSREEKNISSKVHIADDAYRKSKKIFESAEKSLRKEQEAYDKYLRKLPSGKPQTPIVEQLQKIVTQTTITAVTYNDKGIPNQVTTIKFPPANPVDQATTPTNDMVADAKAEGLRQKVEKMFAELQTIQAQTVAARQDAEDKSRELSTLRQQLLDAQQRPRQVESEIKRATQDLRTVEMQNRNQRDAMRQNHNNITETESNIRAKQTEIDKLKGELETIKEQVRKQTDTLSTIKAAWEKAEVEAKALESSIQDNK